MSVIARILTGALVVAAVVFIPLWIGWWWQTLPYMTDPDPPAWPLGLAVLFFGSLAVGALFWLGSLFWEKEAP